MFRRGRECGSGVCCAWWIKKWRKEDWDLECLAKGAFLSSFSLPPSFPSSFLLYTFHPCKFWIENWRWSERFSGKINQVVIKLWQWELRDRANRHWGHKISRSGQLNDCVGISKRDVAWRMPMSFKNRVPRRGTGGLTETDDIWFLDALKC